MCYAASSHRPAAITLPIHPISDIVGIICSAAASSLAFYGCILVFLREHKRWVNLSRLTVLLSLANSKDTVIK